ncbi:MAG: DUF1570 domain-containing protein [Planctomycetota bacterium]|nr:DUF1570 domain-containing protein [Planctomycetota bacterium]
MQNLSISSNSSSSNLRRRDWIKKTACFFCSWFAVTQPTKILAFLKRDWLQFYYSQEPPVLESLLGSLRQLPQRVSQLYGYPVVVSPVSVIVFSDRASYLAHLERTLPKAPRRSSLFVVRGGRPTILVSQGATLAQDLMHEAVHALNYSTFQNGILPLWMDEGLAEWFEADVDQQDRVHGLVLQQLLGNQRRMLPEPLRLSSLERIKSTTRADAVDYAASWAWCRFLSNRKDRCHEIWAGYLRDLKEGRPAGRLSHRLSLSIPDYEKMFLASL